jgi:hypothetical protein
LVLDRSSGPSDSNPSTLVGRFHPGGTIAALHCCNCVCLTLESGLRASEARDNGGESDTDSAARGQYQAGVIHKSPKSVSRVTNVARLPHTHADAERSTVGPSESPLLRGHPVQWCEQSSASSNSTGRRGSRPPRPSWKARHRRTDTRSRRGRGSPVQSGFPRESRWSRGLPGSRKRQHVDRDLAHPRLRRLSIRSKSPRSLRRAHLRISRIVTTYSASS